MGSLVGLLNVQVKTIEESPIWAVDLARLLALVEEDVISGKIAKSVFEEMARSGKPAKQIVEEKGLVQITDTDALDAVILETISNYPKEVEAYKNGKTKLLGFFVGQIMKETRGQANPKLANQLLKQKLKDGVDWVDEVRFCWVSWPLPNLQKKWW